MKACRKPAVLPLLGALLIISLSACQTHRSTLMGLGHAALGAVVSDFTTDGSETPVREEYHKMARAYEKQFGPTDPNLEEAETSFFAMDLEIETTDSNERAFKRWLKAARSGHPGAQHIVLRLQHAADSGRSDYRDGGNRQGRAAAARVALCCQGQSGDFRTQAARADGHLCVRVLYLFLGDAPVQLCLCAAGLCATAG